MSLLLLFLRHHFATGAATLPRLTASAAGVHEQAATGAATLPRLTAAATATHEHIATGAAMLPRLTLAAVGVMQPEATGAATLPRLTADGWGYRQPEWPFSPDSGLSARYTGTVGRGSARRDVQPGKGASEPVMLG